MNLSGLETVILSLFVAILTAIMAIGRMTRRLMTTENCAAIRNNCDLIRAERFITSAQKIQHLQDSITDLQESNDIQYSMLRALVAHMPGLSAKEREHISNINRP